MMANLIKELLILLNQLNSKIYNNYL